MNRRLWVGATLLGFGIGILLSTLFPWLRLFWPLIALLVAAMLWRRAGTPVLRIALSALALSWAFSALNFNSKRFSVPEVGGVNVSENSRVLTTLRASNVQLENWQNASTFKIINAVGTVSIEGGEELSAEILYRTTRRRARTPEHLQASFDKTTRSLTLIGIDPEAGERERRGLSADIILKIPADAAVNVVTEVADINIASVAKANLTTSVGNLRAEAIGGDLQAVSETGDIRVHNSEGAVDVRSNVGSLNLSFDNAVSSPINARTKVGDIMLSLPQTSNVRLRALSELQDFAGDLERVTPSEGRLLLGDEGTEVTLETDVGEIEVRTY